MDAFSYETIGNEVLPAVMQNVCAFFDYISLFEKRVNFDIIFFERFKIWHQCYNKLMR